MSFFARLFGTGKTVLNFLMPVLKSSAGKVIETALPIALSIVSDLENGQLPSDAKRSAAFTMLKNSLEQQGMAAAAGTLNLIIEMAVSKLKTTQ